MPPEIVRLCKSHNKMSITDVRNVGAKIKKKLKDVGK